MATQSPSIDGKMVADMKVADLKLELERRGLSKTGVKAELVKRLEKAVAGSESTTPAEESPSSKAPVSSPEGTPKGTARKTVTRRKIASKENGEEFEDLTEDSGDMDNTEAEKQIEEEQSKLEKAPVTTTSTTETAAATNEVETSVENVTELNNSSSKQIENILDNAADSVENREDNNSTTNLTDFSSTGNETKEGKADKGSKPPEEVLEEKSTDEPMKEDAQDENPLEEAAESATAKQNGNSTDINDSTPIAASTSIDSKEEVQLETQGQPELSSPETRVEEEEKVDGDNLDAKQTEEVSVKANEATVAEIKIEENFPEEKEDQEMEDNEKEEPLEAESPEVGMKVLDNVESGEEEEVAVSVEDTVMDEAAQELTSDAVTEDRGVEEEKSCADVERPEETSTNIKTSEENPAATTETSVADTKATDTSLPTITQLDKDEGTMEVDTKDNKEKIASEESKVAAQKDEQKKELSKSLWISGLSNVTRAVDLKSKFSTLGKVVGAKVVTSARSPGTHCFGFVTMSTVEEASKCIENLNKTELCDRTITVERAKTDPTPKKISDKTKQERKKSDEKNSSTTKGVATKSTKSDSSASGAKDEKSRTSGSSRDSKQDSRRETQRRRTPERSLGRRIPGKDMRSPRSSSGGRAGYGRKRDDKRDIPQRTATYRGRSRSPRRRRSRSRERGPTYSHRPRSPYRRRTDSGSRRGEERSTSRSIKSKSPRNQSKPASSTASSPKPKADAGKGSESKTNRSGKSPQPPEIKGTSSTRDESKATESKSKTDVGAKSDSGKTESVKADPSKDNKETSSDKVMSCDVKVESKPSEASPKEKTDKKEEAKKSTDGEERDRRRESDREKERAKEREKEREREKEKKREEERRIREEKRRKEKERERELREERRRIQVQREYERRIRARKEEERIRMEREKERELERERQKERERERERIARERREREQREREDRERIERERLERERLERDRLHRERMERERLERERLERERLDRERIERERLERDRERIKREIMERDARDEIDKERSRLERERRLLEERRSSLKRPGAPIERETNRRSGAIGYWEETKRLASEAEFERERDSSRTVESSRGRLEVSVRARDESISKRDYPGKGSRGDGLERSAATFRRESPTRYAGSRATDTYDREVSRGYSSQPAEDYRRVIMSREGRESPRNTLLPDTDRDMGRPRDTRGREQDREAWGRDKLSAERPYSRDPQKALSDVLERAGLSGILGGESRSRESHADSNRSGISRDIGSPAGHAERRGDYGERVLYGNNERRLGLENRRLEYEERRSSLDDRRGFDDVRQSFSDRREDMDSRTMLESRRLVGDERGLNDERRPAYSDKRGPADERRLGQEERRPITEERRHGLAERRQVYDERRPVPAERRTSDGMRPISDSSRHTRSLSGSRRDDTSSFGSHRNGGSLGDVTKRDRGGANEMLKSSQGAWSEFGMSAKARELLNDANAQIESQTKQFMDTVIDNRNRGQAFQQRDANQRFGIHGRHDTQSRPIAVQEQPVIQGQEHWSRMPTQGLAISGTGRAVFPTVPPRPTVPGRLDNLTIPARPMQHIRKY